MTSSLLYIITRVAAPRLRITIKPAASVTEAEFSEIFALYAPAHHASEAEVRQRLADGLDLMALFRYRVTGQLVGLTGLRAAEVPLPGGQVAYSFYLGLSYVAPEARGNSLIQLTVLAIYLRYRLRHPLNAVYFWSDAISYKPYLVMCRYLRRGYPNRRFPTPPTVQALIKALGQRHYGAQFDPATGTVRKQYNRLRPDTAPIRPDDLADPDIRFYAELNPRHAQGDGLIVAAPANLENLWFFLRKKWRSGKKPVAAGQNARSVP